MELSFNNTKRKNIFFFALCVFIRTFIFDESTLIRKKSNKICFFTHLSVPLPPNKHHPTLIIHRDRFKGAVP